MESQVLAQERRELGKYLTKLYAYLRDQQHSVWFVVLVVTFLCSLERFFLSVDKISEHQVL